MRFTFKVILGILGGLLVLGLLVKAESDRHFFSAYDHNVPLNARIAESVSRDSCDHEKIYFDSTPGEAIPTLLNLPKQRPGKVPCIVFLHGIGQEKEFVDDISPMFNEAGWAMASFDQYTRGERKFAGKVSMWQQLTAFRQRACKTVNDARRLVDYLETRPEIDPERIYLVGASYGAITGTTAAAFDPRFKAVVLVYGGGNLRLLLNSDANRAALGTGPLGWLKMDIVIAGARYLMAPADPVRYAPLISPRPVFLQNGTNDMLIPTEASKALQDAVREPKKVSIYPGNHIGTDEAMVWKVLKDALQWLQEQDKIVTGAAAPQAIK